MKNTVKTIITVISCLLAQPEEGWCEGHPTNLKLHYDRPAEHFEEALVIGNGKLGAIVYGGVGGETISLNDITLWTGEPEKGAYTPDAHKSIPAIRTALANEDYRTADKLQRNVQGHYSQNYQPLGTLSIEHLDADGKLNQYERWLDITDATAHTRYQQGKYIVTTDYFASAPDSIIVVHLKTDRESGLHTLISFNSQLPHTATATNGEISAEGYAAYHSFPSYYRRGDKKHFYDPERGIHFRTLIHIIAPEDATVQSYPTGELKVKGGREATIILTNSTSFNGFDKDPVREGYDYQGTAVRNMQQALQYSYPELLERHTTDYKHYFDRVKLNLGKTDAEIAALPTDQQLLSYTDKQQHNPELEALYFQYGRYLLISCSRTPGVPANLQGLWNEKLLPPWSCNYTSNINVEENYWPAETANLSEMHRPLLKFIENLHQTGRTTAQAYYGVEKGWCLGQNTDIWAMTCPVGLHVGDPSWACWTMGGAWLATHIWEHYLFTQDRDYLKTAYPTLKAAAEFCLHWLVEHDGYLLTSPGTSPENKYRTPDGYIGATSYGSTADLAMTRECLMNTYEAAHTLGMDKTLRKQIEKTLKHLLPYQIGHKGNLQEWYHDWEDQDPRHRHQSHLFGLYPGHHLSVKETPELARACARTLEIKGDETTGWSTGWRVNLYARLHDAPGAYHIYRKLLRYVSPDGYKGNDARRGGGTYPNLLDAHSPFQIDGNFGGCAGVIEMLMQSSPEEITLLPALPDAWADGHVSGICARGGFVIDMTWSNGKVTALTVTARQNGKTTIRFNGTSKNIRLKANERKTIKL